MSRIYCGNQSNFLGLTNGTHILGTNYQCLRKGIGIGLNMPYDHSYSTPYAPIDARKYYCGNNPSIPRGGAYFAIGSPIKCLTVGIGVGKSQKAAIENIRRRKRRVTRSKSKSKRRTIRSKSKRRVTRSKSKRRTIRSKSKRRTIRSKSKLRVIRSKSKRRTIRSKSKRRIIRSKSKRRLIRSKSKRRLIRSKSNKKK